jgi:cephalosporin hydroxylase
MDQAELNRAYFETGEWARTYYKGVPIFKYPSDLFVYEQIIAETNPDVIVELGTLQGGSALWLRDHSNADIFSVDVAIPPNFKGSRIRFLNSNSLDLDLKSFDYKRVMVILDSDHRKDHVLAEIKKFAPLVTKGCYLVIEDTSISKYLDNVDGHNDYSGGSSWEAVQEWDKEGFESVDLSMMLSMNPGGWFKRV